MYVVQMYKTVISVYLLTYDSCVNEHMFMCLFVVDIEGDDGGDRLRPWWNSHSRRVDQRGNDHYPLAGSARHGDGASEFLCVSFFN